MRDRARFLSKEVEVSLIDGIIDSVESAGVNRKICAAYGIFLEMGVLGDDAWICANWLASDLLRMKAGRLQGVDEIKLDRQVYWAPLKTIANLA